MRIAKFLILFAIYGEIIHLNAITMTESTLRKLEAKPPVVAPAPPPIGSIEPPPPPPEVTPPPVADAPPVDSDPLDASILPDGPSKTDNDEVEGSKEMMFETLAEYSKCTKQYSEPTGSLVNERKELGMALIESKSCIFGLLMKDALDGVMDGCDGVNPVVIRDDCNTSELELLSMKYETLCDKLTMVDFIVFASEALIAEGVSQEGACSTSLHTKFDKSFMGNKKYMGDDCSASKTLRLLEVSDPPITTTEMPADDPVTTNNTTVTITTTMIKKQDKFEGSSTVMNPKTLDSAVKSINQANKMFANLDETTLNGTTFVDMNLFNHQSGSKLNYLVALLGVEGLGNSMFGNTFSSIRQYSSYMLKNTRLRQLEVGKSTPAVPISSTPAPPSTPLPPKADSPLVDQDSPTTTQLPSLVTTPPPVTIEGEGKGPKLGSYYKYMINQTLDPMVNTTFINVALLHKHTNMSDCKSYFSKKFLSDLDLAVTNNYSNKLTSDEEYNGMSDGMKNCNENITNDDDAGLAYKTMFAFAKIEKLWFTYFRHAWSHITQNKTLPTNIEDVCKTEEVSVAGLMDMTNIEFSKSMYLNPLVFLIAL